MRKITLKKRKDFLAEGKNEVRYPKFSIDLEHLPEAEKWDIGKKYTLTLELEMTGLNIEKKEDYNNASFDIKGIDVPKAKKSYKLLQPGM